MDGYIAAYTIGIWGVLLGGMLAPVSFSFIFFVKGGGGEGLVVVGCRFPFFSFSYLHSGM